MKFQFVNQLESNDCGPACLAMVSNFYGKQISLKDIKSLSGLTRMGVSVKDLLTTGKILGLESNGVKLTLSQLSEIPLPAILFWKQDHFIVLYKIIKKEKKNLYYIADPSYGKTKIDEDILVREWLGNNEKSVCLLFQPTESFLISDKKERLPSKSKTSEIKSQLLAFAKGNKYVYLLSFILLAFGLSANWIMPMLFKRIIDDGIIAKSLNLVVILLLAQFVIFIGNTISQFFSDVFLTKLNFKLSVSLKENFLNKLIKLPVNYFDTRLNTETLLRLSDLSKLQGFLTWKGIGFFINILNLLVFSIILFFLNKLIFLIFLILSLATILWVLIFLKRRATLEYSMFIRQSDNSNNLYEFIMNMPEIKINQAQNAVISKIISLQHKLNDLELKSLFLNMYQVSGANFFSKLKEASIIAICAYLIINDQMSIGTLLGISYILGQLNGPILGLVNNIRDWQDASISQKRVDDVFGVENEDSIFNNSSVPLALDDIKLEKISFKYPGSFNPFVIEDLSFSIPKNKITAIVGSSGSGKTTLMKLLMMYYRPNRGNILLGANDLYEYHPDKWREKCGVVLQDGNIFSGTIKYNITLCENEMVNEHAFLNAIKIACLDEFINSLALNSETKIGNVGMQLSGGQSQRVLIARAVYKNPDFIFFDEATSSLDANTERAILNNLDDFFKGRTVVVIAHRLSTVKNADQIIVMEKGRILEKGTHNELVNQRSKYYSLIKNQLELG
ncbi:MAG: peptidase domain-containing ABC transporter [Leadbetterella sp.]|nr:peptidase domain-containing ABC transporter [Leadbetterella sp.]